ncbi:MAG: tetratricopeptide repeat protein [Dehalococcoidia bacterium]
MNRQQRRTAARRKRTPEVLQRPAPLFRPPGGAFDVDAAVTRAAQSLREGRLRDAEITVLEVLRHDPDQADARNMLGMVAHVVGKHDVAVEHIGHAIGVRPEEATFHANLGTARMALDELEQAEEHFRRAIELDGGHASAHSGLGIVFRRQGRATEAIEQLQRAITIAPSLAAPHRELAILTTEAGEHEQALEHLRRASALGDEPSTGLLSSQLIQQAWTCEQRGLAEEAVERYREALALRADPGAHSNLLLALHYRDRDLDDLFAEHRTWVEQHAASITPLPPPQVDLDPDRRLRIGYVTPGLGGHSVGYFLRPLLEAHDREAVEVTTYIDHWGGEGPAEWLEQLSDRSHDVTGMPHAAVAELVREDRIDVLIDIAGHTVHNRLLTFALRPAPVQASYCGYISTTALDAIDYRITDRWADPEGMTERFYTEQLMRLPGGHLCYRPPPDAPQPAPPPHVERGHVTFGTFSNLIKVGPEVIALWARILHAVPGSRFVYQVRALADADTRERVLAAFAEHDIEAGRVELIGETASHLERLEQTRNVDIALDSFPHVGVTTNCEALWMGVPVVTLAGRAYGGRVTTGLLHAVDLDDLVAADHDAYVAIAARLAGDGKRLIALRSSLRPAMAAAPLCDSGRIAREMEDAYRTMWRSYVRQGVAA